MKKSTFGAQALAVVICVIPALPCTAAIDAEDEKRDGFVEITSVEELRQYMAESGNKVRMKPGVYQITDAMPDNRTVFHVSGSNNYFDLRKITLQIDTQVFADMRGPVHSLCAYRVLGDNLTFEGAVFEDVGEHPPSRSMTEFQMNGDNNTFKDCTFIVRGSAPYGYGDYFGKGRKPKTRLHKHSAMAVLGDNAQILNCRFEINTFGHAIFMQGAQKTVIKDTQVEGKLRLTDEILAEKSGLAAELGYKDIHDEPIQPGLMVALAEDGIRAYYTGTKDGVERKTGNITVDNCTVHRMRGGIVLALATGEVSVTNCTVTESGYPGTAYAFPNNAVVRNCKGDAAYAPLMQLGYSHKKNADIKLELLDAKEYLGNDLVALINGVGHKITFSRKAGTPLAKPLGIVLGKPCRGDKQDIDTAKAHQVELINQTQQPVLLTERARDCRVKSVGKVTDKGKNNTTR